MHIWILTAHGHGRELQRCITMPVPVPVLMRSHADTGPHGKCADPV